MKIITSLVIALCLCCLLSGIVLADDAGIDINAVEYNDSNGEITVSGTADCQRVIVQLWDVTNSEMLTFILSDVSSGCFSATVLTNGLENGEYLVKVANYQGGSYSSSSFSVPLSSPEPTVTPSPTPTPTDTPSPTYTSTPTPSPVLQDTDPTQKVVPATENGMAKAVLTGDDLDDVMQKAGKASGKLTIEILMEEVQEDGVVMDFPSEVLDIVKEEGLDKVEFKLGLATISMPPDFLEGTDGTETSEEGGTSVVSLEVKKVAVAEIIDTLDEEQKEMLGEEDTIYDFNASVNSRKVTRFNSKISIRIPYTLKEGDDPDCITALYLADDGIVRNMVGWYDEKTSEACFETDHFSKYLIKNVTVVYSDIPSDFWAWRAIVSMASKGIIEGKDEGIFYPNDSISRVEFVKMLVLAAGMTDYYAAANFNDVDRSDWYYIYVASAAQERLVNGFSDGSFRPDSFITRQEAAIMVARAMGERPAGNLESLEVFADRAEISDWALEEVAVVVGNGILSGRPNNLIAPVDTVTRAEAITIIYRFFNRFNVLKSD